MWYNIESEISFKSCFLFHFVSCITIARLRIEYLSANAYADINGKNCDPVSRSCDTFILVFVNNTRVFGTSTITGRNPHFNEIHKTREYYDPKTTVVRVEMWDQDNIGSNDLMGRWTLRPDQINGFFVTLKGPKNYKRGGKKLGNTVTIVPRWTVL